MADRVRPSIMNSRILHTACALIVCFGAAFGAAAASSPSAQAQIEAARRQYSQALDRGDINAAERYDREIRALEARGSVAAPPPSLLPAAASTAIPSAAPVTSFFSAPSGRVATPPAETSSVFNAPAVPATGYASPAFTPSNTRSGFNPASGSTTVTPRPANPSSAPQAGVTSLPPFTSPAAGSGTAAPVVSSPASGFPGSTPAVVPSIAEEPRPVELPPGVLDAREANAVLSKLEDFRMAESRSGRRSTGLAPDPVAPAPSPANTFAPAPTIPPATSTPSFGPSTSVASSVQLSGAPDDLRRKLEDVTRRKSELQLEAERLVRENTDWEARYNAARAELARLESENKASNRLQSIRSELDRLDSDSTKLMQEIEAARASQERAAREVLARPATSATATFTLPPTDRPVVPAALGAAPAEPDRKGPQFRMATSTRSTAGGSGSEGNIVRTGRSGADSVALQRDLDRLAERKQYLLREIDDLQTKFQATDREFAMANRTGQQGDMDRLAREKDSLDARFKSAQAELLKVEAEMQSKVSEFKSAMGASDPDKASQGDAIQIIVAEDDSFNGVYSVKRDGNIILPRVGRVQVGGRDISEVEAAVKALLEETQLTKATVTAEFKSKAEKAGGGIVATDDPVIIYLAGEFITPGPLKIPPGVSPTLITTIIRSGGITPSGDLTRTKLLRIENGQGAVEEVNVAAILSGSIPPTDIALNPGDIIMIPAFAPVVYVTGNVTKPGTLRLFQDETLTAYAAILRAGGFSRFANLKKCSVVRELGNGEKVQMPLNVKEIQKGLAPDIVLQGKDIVVVPESFFSF